MGASISSRYRLDEPESEKGSKKRHRKPILQQGDGRRILLFVLVLVAAWYCWRFLDWNILQIPSPGGERAGRPGSVTIATSDPKGVSDFSKYSDGEWVTGSGTVTLVLVDDNEVPRHQRFILKDAMGRTILVAHNIDEAPRVKGLEKGDVVDFRGEFRKNDRGGVVHWTHPDSSGRRKGGWVRRR